MATTGTPKCIASVVPNIPAWDTNATVLGCPEISVVKEVVNH